MCVYTHIYIHVYMSIHRHILYIIKSDQIFGEKERKKDLLSTVSRFAFETITVNQLTPGASRFLLVSHVGAGSQALGTFSPSVSERMDGS